MTTSEPMSPDAGDSSAIPWDPVFLHARREAIVIFFLWLVTMLWAVPFCYLTGYTQNFDPANFSTTWGVPTWLFWGIAVPWIAADIFTIWFCFCYMVDDDLGVAHEGEDIEEEVAEMHKNASDSQPSEGGQ